MRSLMVWIACATAVIATQVLAAPATRPAQPATQGANVRAKITPEAQEVLDRVYQAYSKLKTLKVDGTEVAESLRGGAVVAMTRYRFVGWFAAPNKFRLEHYQAAGIGERLGVASGSDGSLLYLHWAYNNTYHEDAAPAQMPAAFDPPSSAILNAYRNPSIRVALWNGGVAADYPFIADAQIDRAPDERIGERSFVVLVMSVPRGRRTTRHLVDPDLWLVRRTIDQVGDTARTTYDYGSTQPNVDVPQGQLAWTPPPTASKTPDPATRRTR